MNANKASTDFHRLAEELLAVLPDSPEDALRKKMRVEVGRYLEKSMRKFGLFQWLKVKFGQEETQRFIDLECDAMGAPRRKV